MKFAFAAALIAAASAVEVEWQGGYSAPSYGGYGSKGSYARVSYQPVTKVVQPARRAEAASAGYGRNAEKRTVSDWDAWGRDQDLAIDESYGKTKAKSYAAESYDEWDNKDDDKWGAQAWGKDRDMRGASSKASVASAADYDQYGQAYGGKQGYQGYSS
jgi:hypothetical protein